MAFNDIQNLNLFDRNFSGQIKLASAQKDLFNTLWADERLIAATKTMFDTELTQKSGAPILKSPFGEIVVDFVHSVGAKNIRMTAVFWYLDHQGVKQDFYYVTLFDSAMVWRDKYSLPFDWDASEMSANTVTMGEVVKRVLAERLTMEDLRVSSIRNA